MTDIGKRILEARRRRGLSQKALAEALGVTVQAVSQWENGKTDPSSRTIPLAEALHVNESWLSGEIVGPVDRFDDEVVEKTALAPLVDFQDFPYFLRFLSRAKSIVCETYLSSTVEARGDLFAARIHFDMHNFQAGDILIFDNGVEALAGDYAAILIFNNDFSQMAAIQDPSALANVVTGP